jgi:Tol biopolymer transport system component
MEPRKGMAISPTGDLVWSTCRTTFEVSSLDVTSARGSELRKVSGGTWMDHMPVGVPGTRSLVLVSDRGGPPGLWVIDRDGATPPREVPIGGLAATDPAVSSDRRWIAFAVAGNGIYVVPFDGREAPRQITTGGDDSVPAFAGDDVVYQGERDGHGVTMAVPIAGGTPRVELAGALIPDVSRDGRWLVYRAAGSDEIWLHDRQTGHAKRLSSTLAPGPYQYVRFSPDGERVLISLANEVLEVEIATGKVLHTHDTGGDQVTGITYVGDEMIVSTAIWQGDLWIAHGELVVP